MQRNQACTQVYVHDLPFAHESKQSNDSLRLMPDPDLSCIFAAPQSEVIGSSHSHGNARRVRLMPCAPVLFAIASL
jgi:hypothetical protein